MVAAQPQEPLYMSEAQYLALEEQSDIKHEYVDGQIFAMAGTGWNHNIINGNVQTSLNNQLAGKGCSAVSSDMRLKVESKKVSFRYPDTMVICGEPEFVDERSDTISNPTVIIEVLSPSTALKDHNEKLHEYTKIESVQEYVLISQHEVKVERYLRQSDGNWLYTLLSGLSASIELPSIDCSLDLAKVYDKTRDLS